jgi:hypothetical protein
MYHLVREIIINKELSIWKGVFLSIPEWEGWLQITRLSPMEKAVLTWSASYTLPLFTLVFLIIYPLLASPNTLLSFHWIQPEFKAICLRCTHFSGCLPYIYIYIYIYT